MRILRAKDSAQGAHLVLMFGLGMLGSAIAARLQDLRYATAQTVDFHWNEPGSWPEALAALERHCRIHAPRRISVSWTAGGGGFACSEAEARRENEFFLAVMDLTDRLRQLPVLDRLDFHYMSSAGGLFEGQTVVNEHSAPAPRRPYGQLKLSQERLLRERFAQGGACIYRPSTVYGPMVPKARHGLINNLVSDGLGGRLTVLDAHVMSLRDYVYFADIGAFVAKRICAGARRSGAEPAHFLVSSRCASIFEVVRTIERVLHLKLRFRYDANFGNHSNITFSERILPEDWSPTPLDVGIRQFVAGRYARASHPARAFPETMNG